MSIDCNISGVVRGAGATSAMAAGSMAEVNLSPGGSVYVIQSLPPRAEIARQGASWYKVSDAVATLNSALPTTTASHALWNGDQTGGGKCYVMDRVSWVCGVSAAAASMFSMHVMLSRTPYSAAPATADTLTRIQGLSGKPYTGRAVGCKSVTVTDEGWLPIGNAINTAAITGTVGASIEVVLDGQFVVPPGYLFCMCIMGTNGTSTGKAGFVWHEVNMNI